LRLLTLFLIEMSAMVFAAGAEQAPTAARGKIPFQVGEKLNYVLKWSVIPVGEAELRVSDGETKIGSPAYLFQASVKSYPMIDLIYKVRDHVESYTDRSMIHSLLYRKKQREGKHKRDVSVEFDWDQSKAHYYSKGKHKKTVTLLPGTFDPLGVFYAFRLNPLTDNLEVEAPVTDGQKCVMGKARVIRREKVAVDAGAFDTFLIEPELRHIGGIFKKSKDAKLLLWVTADDRRIVVKAKSKVAVGHFTAELVSMEGVVQ
jgi:hypothetical protein